MTSANPSDGKDNKSFWNTTMGTITKITALLTAITGLILAIRPMLKDKTDTPVTKQGGDAGDHKPGPDTPPHNAIDYNNIAQNLATKWISALKISDIEYLVSVSDPPLYVHHNYLFTKEEIREFYRSIIDRNNTNGEKENKTDIFKVGTIAQFKNEGLSGNYLDITKLGLNDNDDYFVQLGDSGRDGKGLLLIFKKSGETLKLSALLSN